MGRLQTGLAIIAVLFLGACAGAPQQQVMTDLPSFIEDPVDPGDEYVKIAMDQFLAETNAPPFSQYHFRRIDLNNDGRREALVVFTNPYGYWCGVYGCTMLVMEAGNKSFQLVNAISPVREPIQISELRTNGWQDIIINVSGRWTETKDVALQFDGRNYPVNPDSLPPVLEYAGATRLFAD